MKKLRFIFYLFVALGMVSCSNDDDLDSKSIYDTNPIERNELDNWILENYVKEYNIDLKYRFDDKESDLDYNVIPADYNKSVALAQLVKYLWMDAYTELLGPDFLRTYCPKIMHFVGSPEYNTASGSMVLGTAEGGMKITLFNVNGLEVKNPDMDLLNEWYFKTMHHEFAHILHQTKNYSTDFNQLSDGKYTGEGWVNITNKRAREMGFVTNYASTLVDEDFVETIANYIVKSDEEWQQILDDALVKKNGKVVDDSGRRTILAKFQMVKDYLANSWNIDLVKLHENVQERQAKVPEMDWETLK